MARRSTRRSATGWPRRSQSAVAYALSQLGISYRFVSRTPATGQFAYTDLTRSLLQKYLLIINCTPLGTFPNISDCHKGQKSRTGGGVRRGFEGGQMPLYRRLPKFGFTSMKSAVTAEVRLNELTKVEGNVVTLEALKAANILTKDIQFAKVILAGEVKSAVTVRGLRVTKGAKAAIEAAGGSVEE